MRRRPLTPFGASANQPRCPLCGSVDLLPLAPTSAGSGDTYCAHCPWESRKKAPHNRPAPRAIGGSQAPAPIHAGPHLVNRERERRRWHDTEPSPAPKPEPNQGFLSELERLQMAGVVVLGLTCLVACAIWAFC